MTVSEDVELFRSISNLIKEVQDVKTDDRRTVERRPYPCFQLLAFYEGTQLPAQSEFRRVQCRDLSAEGFAFLADERPLCSRVIVALGRVPFKFFVAEVRHIGPADIDSEFRYSIGCRFVERLTPS